MTGAARYAITGVLSCDDHKRSRSIEAIVERSRCPTREEARDLLRDEVRDHLEECDSYSHGIYVDDVRAATPALPSWTVRGSFECQDCRESVALSVLIEGDARPSDAEAQAALDVEGEAARARVGCGHSWYGIVVLSVSAPGS